MNIIIHSVNQFSIFGGLIEEEKGRFSFPVNNNSLTKLNPEAVQLVVSHPTKTTGNRPQENVLRFEALAGKIQLTLFGEKAYFQCRVAAGKQHKIRRVGDDGWETITPPCWEYSSSRTFPKTQILAAIPEGTIIGPVLEVQVCENYKRYGTEVAIPSFANPVNTSHVVFSRETERFVNEIRDHKEDLRSSNEFLTHQGNLCGPSQRSSYKPLHKKNHSYE